MSNIILIAAGGAIGSSLRYTCSNIIKYIYPHFSFGTLFVNILGSFFIGILMSYLKKNGVSENFIKYFLIIGLLGSFTTFSAFSFEIIELLNNKKFLISIFYILISVFLCITFTYLGYNLNNT